MNKLGFGFLRLPQIDGQIDFETVNTMVDTYIAAGGDYFDTAYTYLDGRSEEAIRKCVVERYSRDSYRLATKIPGYYAKSYADCFRYFEESAKKCGVDYFDVYMLHWMTEEHYRIAQQLHQFDFLAELKRTGKAKRIGFSFHATADLLDRILTDHPEVDCVLLQVNYLDWDSPAIQSRRCLEVAKAHGKEVIVMEPVKGGRLAKVPDEAGEILKKIDPEASPADIAVRFAKGLEDVHLVLSGMNSTDQMEQNLQNHPPMSAQELDYLRQAAKIILDATAVACTGCGYCLSNCPQSVPIPDCFSLYNEYTVYPRHQWKIIPAYEKLSIKASSCISCGSCESHCPQKLPIPQYLKDVAKALEE